MGRERTGSVKALPNGRWEARVTWKDPSTGRRRSLYDTTCRNVTEARRRVKELVRQSEETTQPRSAVVTVGQAIEAFRKIHQRPAQYRGGKKITGLHSEGEMKRNLDVLATHFADLRLDAVTWGVIAEYRQKRLDTKTTRGTPRSLATMNRELGYLRSVFVFAINEGWISRNPFRAGKPLISPADETKRMRFLTIDEEKRLLDELDTPRRRHLIPFFIAALDTGARAGELERLTWADVDFPAGVIRVVSRKGKNTSEREVPMTHRLREQLTALKTRALDSELVFGVHEYKTGWATALRNAQIDNFQFRDLRHTFATRLAEAGFGDSLIARLLGHTNVRTTFIYTNANRDTVRRAAAALDDRNSLRLVRNG